MDMTTDFGRAAYRAERTTAFLTIYEGILGKMGLGHEDLVPDNSPETTSRARLEIMLATIAPIVASELSLMNELLADIRNAVVLPTIDEYTTEAENPSPFVGMTENDIAAQFNALFGGEGLV